MKRPVLALATAGLLFAPVPVLAQFPEQDIPQNCLNENGRLMLTGANYEECKQYAYVEGDTAATDTGTDTGAASVDGVTATPVEEAAPAGDAAPADPNAPAAPAQ